MQNKNEKSLPFRELEKRLEAISALIDTDCLWKLSRHSLLEPALSYGTTHHDRPFCRAVKRENEPRCVQQDLVYVAGLLERRRKSFTMRCHAGAEEFIIPVFREERLLGTVVCGPFRFQEESVFCAEYRDLPEWKPEFATALEIAVASMISPLVRELYRYRPDLLPVPVGEERVIKVLEYLHDRYAEKITVETAAREVFLSGSRLSHLFREVCRVDFSTYLLKLRILAARELLEGTELTVAEVAAQSGFSGQHHFAAIFRKQTGMTATEWRRGRKKVRI